MKLTLALWKENLGWVFKQLWKFQSKRRVVDLGVPKVLLENNVPIYNPKEVLAEPVAHKEPIKVNFPEPYARDPYKSKTPDHPNWKDRPVFLMDKSSKLLEGAAQIELLTKTVEYQGLPQGLSALINQEPLLQQDNLVKNEILRAFVLNGIQIKLPKKIDVTRPGWCFPKVYDLDLNTQITGLLHKLLQLCEKSASTHECVLNRSTLLRRQSKVFVEKDEDLLLFHLLSDVVIASNKPLNPFSSKEEVEMTREMKLPDLYPLKSTIDLKLTNLYTNELIDCTSESAAYFHTLYITHNTVFYWHPPQKLARAIATCFSFAACQARKLYGASVMDLPQPVAVQCVYLDFNKIGFVAYQLNTLNISGEEGLKNQVWVDGPHNLFDSCSYFSGVKEYNNDVFSKFLAFYLNNNSLT